MAGNRILVSKRNMIIPHVEENLDRGGFSHGGYDSPCLSLLWTAYPHP